jgi:hypothetical protein
MYPGSIFGDLFSEQTEVNICQHALDSPVGKPLRSGEGVVIDHGRTH